MNWLDWLIVISIIASLVSGFASGLAASLCGLAGIIGGILLAQRFYVPFSGWISFLPETPAKILAFVLIVLAIVIIAAVAGKILTGVLKMVMLGWLNRLGGAVFGVIMGVITVGVFLSLWTGFFGTPAVITESYFGSLILSRFPQIVTLLPSGVPFFQ